MDPRDLAACYDIRGLCDFLMKRGVIEMDNYTNLIKILKEAKLPILQKIVENKSREIQEKRDKGKFFLWPFPFNACNILDNTTNRIEYRLKIKMKKTKNRYFELFIQSYLDKKYFFRVVPYCNSCQKTIYLTAVSNTPTPIN